MKKFGLLAIGLAAVLLAGGVFGEEEEGGKKAKRAKKAKPVNVASVELTDIQEGSAVMLKGKVTSVEDGQIVVEAKGKGGVKTFIISAGDEDGEEEEE